MKLINNDEVSQVLKMADCIRVQERRFVVSQSTAPCIDRG